MQRNASRMSINRILRRLLTKRDSFMERSVDHVILKERILSEFPDISVETRVHVLPSAIDKPMFRHFKTNRNIQIISNLNSIQIK